MTTIQTVHSNTQPAFFAIDKIDNGIAKFAIRSGIVQVTITDPMTTTTGQEWQYTESQIAVTAASGQDIDLLRAARDILLSDVDCLTLRNTDQLAMVAAGIMTATTMTAAQYQALLVYRQALRDITKNFTTLAAVVWPIPPTGINP